MNTAKIKRSGSESSKTMGSLRNKNQRIFDIRSLAFCKGIVGYFGKYSSMDRGQPLAIIAQARSGFFMVAPVDNRSKVCGPIRAVKQKNLALIQGDFFMKV